MILSFWLSLGFCPVCHSVLSPGDTLSHSKPHFVAHSLTHSWVQSRPDRKQIPLLTSLSLSCVRRRHLSPSLPPCTTLRSPFSSSSPLSLSLSRSQVSSRTWSMFEPLRQLDCVNSNTSCLLSLHVPPAPPPRQCQISTYLLIFRCSFPSISQGSHLSGSQ